jgi:hypothetical protein
MAKAPSNCPMCNKSDKWIIVNETKEGFSVGKAAGGLILFGPFGALGGLLGKKKINL